MGSDHYQGVMSGVDPAKRGLSEADQGGATSGQLSAALRLCQAGVTRQMNRDLSRQEWVRCINRLGLRDIVAAS